MDGFAQFKRFYQKATADGQLRPSHLSVYFGLIWTWQENGFPSSFKIYRKKLMGLAHISSIVTYHKCMRELIELGYILYEPSFNYYQGCRVRLVAI